MVPPELLEDGLPELEALPAELLLDEELLEVGLPEELLEEELLTVPGPPVAGSPEQAIKPPNKNIKASIRLQRIKMGIQGS